MNALSRSVLVLAASLLMACGDDEEPPPPDEFPAETWTVAIYMAADNNLDPFASKDLNELTQTGPPENVEILLFLDRSEKGKYSVGPVAGMDAFNGTRLYRLDSANQWELLEDYGELNSVSPDTLTPFLELAANRDSDRHAIIFWDHGSPARYGTDETDGGNGFSVLELEQAFRLDPEDPTTHHQFDILGFDTCLLSSDAALRALGPVSDIFIGSAELEPGDGWDYNGLIRAMYDDDLDPELFAKKIVRSYGKYYQDNPDRSSGLQVTLAAWRTEFEALDRALFEFDVSVATIYGDTPAVYYSTVRQAVGSSHKYWTTTSGSSRYIDYGELLQNFGTGVSDDALVKKTQEFEEALADMQIAYTSDDAISGTIGLSYTVDRSLIQTESTSRSAGFDRALVEVEDLLKMSDVTSPTVTNTTIKVDPGEVYDVTKVGWSATDDVAIDTVTVFSGLRQADGTILMGVAIDIAAAHGLADASGEQNVPLAMAGLTNTGTATLDQGGLALVVRNQLYIPVAWQGANNQGTALLIADGDLRIQGAAVQSVTGTWAVLTWDDLQEQPFTVSPIRAFYDPATAQLTARPGMALDTNNLKLVPIRLEGEVVTTVVVDDLLPNRASASSP